MEIFKDKIHLTDSIEVGSGKMVLMAGPCAAESYDTCHEVAETVQGICDMHCFYNALWQVFI